jgi:CheY-like chemotaxis protein
MNTSFGSKKALVIDHSSIITKIIKNFLVKSGFEKSNVFAAHDRNQAMMMFELEQFDLITSGIHLRDATGFDLLKEIREQNNDEQRNIPFLIVSAEEQETYQEKLHGYEASNYLRKPFSQDQFQQMIEGLLNHTNLTEEPNEETVTPPSTPGFEWEKSPVEFPPSIINAFTESTIEAMEQYMADAIPFDSEDLVDLNGYFSAWVDLLDSKNRIQTTLIINFPKQAACGIYEGIFGEVDIEQVCGVVQELVNIIGGIAKPRIAGFSKEIISLVYPEKNDLGGEIEQFWDLGLPETKMGENHSLDIEVNGMPKFIVPFKVKDETFHLVVLVQTY